MHPAASMYKKSKQLYLNSFVAFDLETTGLSPVHDRILEIAAIKVHRNAAVDTFESLINPGISIPHHITKINGIDNSMVETAPRIDEILPSFIQFIGDYSLVAHNASFDMQFLCYHARQHGCTIENPSIDSLALCRKAFPECRNHKLQTIARHIHYTTEDTYHRSLSDTKALVAIYIKCCSLLNTEETPQKRKPGTSKGIGL